VAGDLVSNRARARKPHRPERGDIAEFLRHTRRHTHTHTHTHTHAATHAVVAERVEMPVQHESNLTCLTLSSPRFHLVMMMVTRMVVPQLEALVSV
jgi:hypothetical protein